MKLPPPDEIIKNIKTLQQQLEDEREALIVWIQLATDHMTAKKLAQEIRISRQYAYFLKNGHGVAGKGLPMRIETLISIAENIKKINTL